MQFAGSQAAWPTRTHRAENFLRRSCAKCKMHPPCNTPPPSPCWQTSCAGCWCVLLMRQEMHNTAEMHIAQKQESLCLQSGSYGDAEQCRDADANIAEAQERRSLHWFNAFCNLMQWTIIQINEHWCKSAIYWTLAGRDRAGSALSELLHFDCTHVPLWASRTGHYCNWHKLGFCLARKIQATFALAHCLCGNSQLGIIWSVLSQSSICIRTAYDYGLLIDFVIF